MLDEYGSPHACSHVPRHAPPWGYDASTRPSAKELAVSVVATTACAARLASAPSHSQRGSRAVLRQAPEREAQLVAKATSQLRNDADVPYRRNPRANPFPSCGSTRPWPGGILRQAPIAEQRSCVCPNRRS